MLKKIQFVFLFLFTHVISQAEEIDLNIYDCSIYSEHGEDGVIAKIFQAIAPSSKCCVQIQNNDWKRTRHLQLLLLQGWKCFLFNRQEEYEEHNIYKEYVTAENFNQILLEYNIYKIDLLWIDANYNDFYLWESLDEKFDASIVVIQYNSMHLPNEDKVVKYYPYYTGDRTNYFGASMLALYKLGRSKGYSLIFADKTGSHLFFVKDALLQTANIHFKNMNNVQALYRPPSNTEDYNLRMSKDSKNRIYLSSEEFIH